MITSSLGSSDGPKQIVAGKIWLARPAKLRRRLALGLARRSAVWLWLWFGVPRRRRLVFGLALWRLWRMASDGAVSARVAEQQSTGAASDYDDNKHKLAGHFKGKHAHPDDQRVACNYCSFQPSISSSGTVDPWLITSHLLTKHWAKLTPEQQALYPKYAPKPVQTNTLTGFVKVAAEKAALGTNFVARLSAQAVVLGNLPLSVFTDNRGVRLLLSAMPQLVTAIAGREVPADVAEAFQAGFSLPDRRRVRATIADMYGEETQADRKRLAAALAPATGIEPAFAITFDGWSSATLDSYLGVTIHYITAKFHLVRETLACRPFALRHEAANIKALLEEILAPLGLALSRATAGTTDTGSNMKAVLAYTGQWVPCFAHVLNLIMADSEKSIPASASTVAARSAMATITAQVKAVMLLFSKSSKRRAALRGKLVELGLRPLQPLLPVVTRWNSVFYMLKRFDAIWAAVRVLPADLLGKDAVPWAAEVAQLDAVLHSDIRPLLPVLETFNTESQRMQSSRSVTASKARLSLELVRKQLTSVMATSSAVMQVLQCLRESFDERLSEWPAALQLAEALDPYASAAALCNDTAVPAADGGPIIDNTASFVTGKQLPLIKGRQYCEAAASMFVADFPRSTTRPPEAAGAALTGLVPLKALMSTLATNNPIKDTAKITLTVREELFRYWQLVVQQEAAVRAAGVFTDPLEWWRKHATQLPTLAALARRYLAVQATSAECERVFSLAGLILSKRRLRLNGSLADMIIYLHSRLRSAAEEQLAELGQKRKRDDSDDDVVVLPAGGSGGAASGGNGAASGGSGGAASSSGGAPATGGADDSDEQREGADSAELQAMGVNKKIVKEAQEFAAACFAAADVECD
jgi:hypothetical protein